MNNKKEFIRLFLNLLKIADTNIKSLELDSNDIITISFKNGSRHKINVSGNSELAIIYDITGNILGI